MFTKGNRAAAPGKGGSFSVIGADAAIVGDLVTAENLQVNGRIEGDVRCAALHQGASGTIVGNIVADETRIAGLVDGTVTAAIVILEPSARVTGDISYDRLSIESGARVEGRFAHRVALGQEPQALKPASITELFGDETAEAAE